MAEDLKNKFAKELRITLEPLEEAKRLVVEERGRI